MDLEVLLALLETLDTLDDAELANLADDLGTVAATLLDPDADPSDEDLANAARAADAIDAVHAEQQTRTDAATERQERAQALRDRVMGEVEDEASGSDDDGETQEPEHVPAEEVEVVEEPIAASSRRAPARVGRVGARSSRPALPATSGAPSMAFPEWGLVAAANAPGVAQGTPVTDYEQLAAIFANAYRTITGPGLMGPRAQVPLVRAGRGPLGEYGEPRFLDEHATQNAQKIRNVVHPQAITAAGGMCAPIPVSYDLPVIGSSARPVRDTALARFGADRGGVRTLVSPVLTDVTGAIGIWTNQDDIDAGTPGAPDPVKPCLVIDCPDEVETLLQAVTQCFKTGNFRQRFFPEQIEAVLKLISVAAARIAETTILQTMKANSTAVTAAPMLGTARDVLAYLDQAVAAHRDRWRLDDTDRMRFVAHRMLRDAMRADLVRSLPGDPATNFVIADNQIAAWFAARGVNVTWAMESASASGHFGAQNAGALVKWPAALETFLYPEGAFLFLDGGSLDLGLIRDSTLASTNDLMMFSETFEGVHFQGPESTMLTLTHCPDGTVSGTADINPCA